MEPNTLHLIYRHHSLYKTGLWITNNHTDQVAALKHFSGGFVEITYARLNEITYIAKAHGWKVTTEGDPSQSNKV